MAAAGSSQRDENRQLLPQPSPQGNAAAAAPTIKDIKSPTNASSAATTGATTSNVSKSRKAASSGRAARFWCYIDDDGNEVDAEGNLISRGKSEAPAASPPSASMSRGRGTSNANGSSSSSGVNGAGDTMGTTQSRLAAPGTDAAASNGTDYDNDEAAIGGRYPRRKVKPPVQSYSPTPLASASSSSAAAVVPGDAATPVPSVTVGRRRGRPRNTATASGEPSRKGGRSTPGRAGDGNRCSSRGSRGSSKALSSAASGDDAFPVDRHSDGTAAGASGHLPVQRLVSSLEGATKLSHGSNDSAHFDGDGSSNISSSNALEFGSSPTHAARWSASGSDSITTGHYLRDHNNNQSHNHQQHLHQQEAEFEGSAVPMQRPPPVPGHKVKTTSASSTARVSCHRCGNMRPKIFRCCAGGLRNVDGIGELQQLMVQGAGGDGDEEMDDGGHDGVREGKTAAQIVLSQARAAEDAVAQLYERGSASPAEADGSSTSAAAGLVLDPCPMSYCLRCAERLVQEYGYG